MPRRVESQHDAQIAEEQPTLGQAWMSGVIILSWDSVRLDAENHGRGSAVLHEMAHILDAEDGIFDGTPLFDDTAQGAEFFAVATEAFFCSPDRLRSLPDLCEQLHRLYRGI